MPKKHSRNILSREGIKYYKRCRRCHRHFISPSHLGFEAVIHPPLSAIIPPLLTGASPITVQEVLTGSGSKMINAIDRVNLYMWGGGGGAGGSFPSGKGGGGGGGGFIRFDYKPDPQHKQISWTVGKGGSGGSIFFGTGNPPGQPGGNSQFTANVGNGDFTVTAFGGKGGTNDPGGGRRGDFGKGGAGGTSQVIGNVIPTLEIKENGESGQGGIKGGQGGKSFSTGTRDIHGRGGSATSGVGDSGSDGYIILIYLQG
jgi:hypothetical protein